MDAPNRSPSLIELIEQIEAVLPEHTGTNVSELVRLLCKFIPPESRTQLLAVLPDTVSTRPEMKFGAPNSLPATDPGASIVNQCDAFIRRLEDGHYFERVAYDEERREERAFGDLSWSREMDELFARAATAYLSENHALAARIYGSLLSAFRHKHRVGVFCGPKPPEEMIETDTDEAKRRYLRALFIVHPKDDRAKRLRAECERLADVGQTDITLRGLMSASQDGDAELSYNELLPDWIEVLRHSSAEDRSWAREARRLLREAVELKDGADGLGMLARTDGASHPLAWHAWVGKLVQGERWAEAISAAREGLAILRDESHRARLADRLALLAASTGDHEITLEGALYAWRAQPTDVRLLHLVAASNALERTSSVLQREATAALRPDWPHSDALACRLLLLVGRTEQAITRFQRADALGWGRSDHAGSVVLPFVLLALTGLPTAPENSALETLWSSLDTPERTYLDRRLLLDRIGMSGSYETILDTLRPYSALLLEAIRTHGNKVRHSARILDLVQLKVESAVRDILASHNRRGQTLAANLTAALSETISLHRSETDGMAYFRRLRHDWYRFTAYVDALEVARERSPILPNKVIPADVVPAQMWRTPEQSE
jgi:hypothetical protein